jgi:S1-C subfamily serine protease
MLQRSVSAPLGRSMSNSTIGTVGSTDFDFEESTSALRALSRLPPTFSREASQKIRTNGVVKIYNNSARWNLEKPWTIDNEDWSGSGFIIEGRIIATNAHVADGAKMLTLRKQADCQRYPARVLAIAHQVDLAFLTVDDEEFWSNAIELEITTELVSFQDEVHVIGYPTGGDR